MPTEDPEVRSRKLRWRWKALSVWIVVFTVIVFVNLYINDRQNRERIHDLKANRDSIVYAGCIEQNKRHDDTIALMDRRYALISKNGTPEEREAARKSKAYSITLINALAPKRNCLLLVETRQNLDEVPR